MPPRVWDGLAALTQLRRLAVDMAVEQLPQLARLPAGLTALKACVALRIDEGEFVWGWEEGADDDLDLCTVLIAAARAPGLRSLRVSAPGASLSHAGLGNLISARALKVAQLHMNSPQMALHDASALAMIPGLRRLSLHHTRQVARRPRERRIFAPSHGARVQGVGDCFPTRYMPTTATSLLGRRGDALLLYTAHQDVKKQIL